jgi:hypothetical protein
MTDLHITEAAKFPFESRRYYAINQSGANMQSCVHSI